MESENIYEISKKINKFENMKLDRFSCFFKNSSDYWCVPRYLKTLTYMMINYPDIVSIYYDECTYQTSLFEIICSHGFTILKHAMSNINNEYQLNIFKRKYFRYGKNKILKIMKKRSWENSKIKNQTLTVSKINDLLNNLITQLYLFSKFKTSNILDVDMRYTYISNKRIIYNHNFGYLKFDKSENNIDCRLNVSRQCIYGPDKDRFEKYIKGCSSKQYVEKTFTFVLNKLKKYSEYLIVKGNDLKINETEKPFLQYIQKSNIDYTRVRTEKEYLEKTKRIH
jgi:hypothetical protein